MKSWNGCSVWEKKKRQTEVLEALKQIYGEEVVKITYS
jgi:hypothetical protein